MWIKPPSIPAFAVPGVFGALAQARTAAIVIEDRSSSLPGAPSFDRDFATYHERFRGGGVFQTSGLEGPEIPERWQGTMLLGKMTGGKEDVRHERRPEDSPTGGIPPALRARSASTLQMAGVWEQTSFPETNDVLTQAKEILSADAASNNERKLSNQAIAKVVALFREHMVKAAQHPKQLEIASRIYGRFVSEYFAAGRLSAWEAVDQELAELIEIVLDNSADEAIRTTIEGLFRGWDLEAERAQTAANEALARTKATDDAWEPVSLRPWEEQEAEFLSSYHDMVRASWDSDGPIQLAANIYWVRLNFLYDRFDMTEMLAEVLAEGRQTLAHYTGPMSDVNYEELQEEIAEIITKALAAVRDHGEHEREGILGRWMLELLQQQIPPPFRSVIGEEACAMARSARERALANETLRFADGARRLSKWF